MEQLSLFDKNEYKDPVIELKQQIKTIKDFIEKHKEDLDIDYVLVLLDFILM